jgi:glycosyltransferase involved in cell wall biosynthesis
MSALRLEIFAPYASRHFLDVFELLPESRFERRGWFFGNPPGYLGKLGWSAPQPSVMLEGKHRWLSFPAAVNAARKADINVYLGILAPFPWLWTLAVAGIRTGRPAFMVSEGLRKPPVGGLNQMLVTAPVNRPNVCHLGCGDGSTDDFRALGLDRWSYRLYGFAELRAPAPPRQRDPDAVHVLLAGQLIPRKNAVSVLRHLRVIAPANKVVVDIAGDGPERALLEEEARLLPPSVEVRLHGLCSDTRLDELFAQADVFVLPSLYDGWGAVVNQAVAQHVPTLVSARVRAGFGHLVESSFNGFVFHDDDEYRRHLSTLVTDEALRQRFRENAHAIAAKWDIRRMAERLARVLQGEEVERIGGPLDRLHPSGEPRRGISSTLPAPRNVQTI